MDGDAGISVTVATPYESAAFLNSALLRIGYLHPTWTLTTTSNGLVVETSSSVSEAEIRREILYSIYREKILAETMELRRGLLAFVEHT